MATQAKDILAKVRRGEQISEQERSILEAEAARVSRREAGVDQALGRQTPPAQVMPAAQPEPADVGNLFTEPGSFQRGLIDTMAGVGDSLGAMFANDAPAGYEDTPEFQFGMEQTTVPERMSAAFGIPGGVASGIASLLRAQASPMSPAEEAQVRLGSFLDRRPEARQDMFRNTLGEDRVDFTEDPLGNTLMSIEGGDPEYLNKPGPSMRDLTDVADDVVRFAPTGVAANYGFKQAAQAPTFLSRLGRGTLTGTGVSAMGAGTEAGSQRLGQVFGSEQPIDYGDVWAEGAFALGGEALGGLGSRLTREGRAARDRFNDMGIDLSDNPRNQILSTRRNAMQNAPGGPLESPTGRARVTPRGEGVQDLQGSLQRAEREAGERAGAQFDVARERGRNAAISQREIGDLQTRVRNTVEEGQFDIPRTGKTRNLLNTLDRLATPPEGVDPANINVRINSLENWRRQARKRRDVAARGANTQEEAQALRQAIGEYDDWVETQFINDMVSGDEEAVSAWKNAREGWQSFKNRFDGNDIVRKLHQADQLNPESVREMIFGTAELPSNTMASDVVARLDEILGPDSPQMKALRAEVAADITAPLFRETPDIGAFSKKYDKMMDRRPSLMRQLFPDNLDDLHTTARYARGMAREPGAQVGDIDNTPQLLRRYATAFLVGHGIAQGGARMELSRSMLDKFRRATFGGGMEKRLLHEFLGTDPTQNLLPRGVGAVAGATGLNQAQDRAAGASDQPAVEVDEQQAGQTNIRSIMNKARKNPEALTARERQVLQQEAQRVLETQRED